MSTTLRFHVLGDSIAAGVGCPRADQSLGFLLADELGAAGHQVDLRVHAVPRARSADLTPQVRVATAAGVDLALIVIGANDLTTFTPPEVGARLLGEAVAELRVAGARVVVVTAPDLGIVSHVPEVYRAFVSQVSGLYARAQADAVAAAGGTVATVGAELHSRFAADAGLFSADRFHPSPAGYAVIAAALTSWILAAATESAA
jgi:lysophospholipase L1-like esterase